MIKLFYIILFLFILRLSYALEPHNLKFNKIQVDNGLSENSVYCIIQDSQGFMWFGTKDGLNKYDGTNFKIFRHDALNNFSIGNNFIRSIIESDSNSLFLGTDDGFYKMNISTEEFLKIKNKTLEGEEITSAVNTMYKDTNGNIWIGTMTQGIFIYDIHNDILKSVPCNNFDMGKNAIWCFYSDSSNNIWIGSRLGLLKYNKISDNIDKIDGYFSFHDAPKYEILSIQEDNSENLWLGTWANGIKLFNKSTQHYYSYFNSEDSKDYITHIRSLFKYKDSQLLIGSDDGLYLFDTQNKKKTRLDLPNAEYSLSDQNVYSITRDNEGTIWIGTYFGGINYMHAYNQIIDVYGSGTHISSLTGSAISQLCEDENGNLWIATEDGGINYLNTRTNTFTQPLKTSYHNTHALLLDGDKLWIGTFSRGIDIYDITTGKITNHMHSKSDKTSLNDDCIFSIYKTKDDEIFVGTPMGLNRYDYKKKSFEQITEVTDFVYDITEDRHRNIWVATYGKGPVKYDNSSQKWIYYDTLYNNIESSISNSKLTSVHISNQDQLVFTSEGKGIFIYNEENDNFKNISEKEGFPNNVTYGILDDDEGNWWISSNKGIICFNQHDPHNYKIFNKEDGLQSTQFNYKSFLKAKNGKFYFGGVDGLTAFRPESLSLIKNEIIPPVHITNLNLLKNNNKETDIYIKKQLSEKEKIILPYYQNSFQTSFVSLSFVNSNKNKYAYKMNGEDNDWIYTDKKNSIISYVDLKPGSYKFLVLASNNDDLWNSTPTEIEIEILPPWWLSKFFKTFYLLIIMLMLFAIYNFTKKTQRRKHLKQIKKLKNEQDILVLKSKIEFLTTIAHEIKTPLSLIKAPLEDIMLYNKIEDSVKKNLILIDKNCERLTFLVRQLLDFKRLNANKYIINSQSINLFETLYEIYERFKKTASSKNIKFQLKLPQIPAPIIQTDKDALIKIISNLLTNALKYTNDLVILSIEITNNELYTISIEDNGKGISDFHKKLIFDPFFQVKNEYIKEGTGLGLSLAKNLADALSGKIEVYDRDNGGTNFSFIFKSLNITEKLTSQNSILNTEKLIKAKFENIDSDYNKIEYEILIIENNEDLSSYLSKILKNIYNITSLDNAEDAIIVLKEKRIDLIITDIMLPKMNGVEFTKFVKDDINFNHIPIIVLSAKTENSTKIETLLYNADVFIEKPFSSSILKAQIKSLLQNRKQIIDSFNNSPLKAYTSLSSSNKEKHFMKILNFKIEENLSNESFSIETLAEGLNISRSNLQKKLKQISGLTPNDYLINYRLGKACKLLIETDMLINEVAFKVGFSSASYFTKVFQKKYQMLPKEFINKYSRISSKSNNV